MLEIRYVIMLKGEPYLTFAFSQLVHAGNFWSQRFFLKRHLLQALTLRKLEEEIADEPFELAFGEPPGDCSRASSESFATCWLERFFLDGLAGFI